MAKKRSSFVCQSCGHSAARWFGRCSGCGEWNTCVEERPQEVDKRREHIAVTAPRSELQPITEVDDQDHERLQVGIGNPLFCSFFTCLRFGSCSPSHSPGFPSARTRMSCSFLLW